MAYTDKDAQQVEALKEAGCTWMQIGKALGKNGSAVKMWWSRRKARARMPPIPIIKNRITDGRIGLQIKKLACASPGKPMLPLRDYPAALGKLNGAGTPIPKKSTVALFLAKNELVVIKALKKPFISEVNKVKRVAFALQATASERALADLKDNTIWSDETTVRKMPKDKVLYLRCHSTARREDLPQNHQIQNGGFSVMFWGCFSARGVGPLVALEGSQNQHTYITLLQDYVLPELRVARDQFGVEMTFMQDNAPCHKAASVTAFLARHQVKTLDWPPQSPDMNPIENLWAIIKARCQKKFGVPKTAADLINNIFVIWNGIDIALCQKLAESSEKRCVEVLRLNGKAIKY
jgi:hypothetical protein